MPCFLLLGHKHLSSESVHPVGDGLYLLLFTAEMFFGYGEEFHPCEVVPPDGIAVAALVVLQGTRESLSDLPYGNHGRAALGIHYLAL